MNYALAITRAQLGMSAPSIAVEVHLRFGLPKFVLVGLPEAEVREARNRVQSAIEISGLHFPNDRVITVNLAPADLPKESGRFDLAIALGILAASAQIPADCLHAYEFAGELALSGELRSIHGALACAVACDVHKTLILPKDNATEASLAQGIKILVAKHLIEVVRHLTDSKHPLPIVEAKPPVTLQALVDFDDVRGQWQAKRALEIAAAGGHHVLMAGPPGSGKSMLAQRFNTLLPALTQTQALECAVINNIARRPVDAERWLQRPFRNPHHSATAAALVGGGSIPKPGEISLAHHGVLFLDELTEFPRHVLDQLREPLEAGKVIIARAGQHSEFPSRFQLIAAMNPCPCGFLGHPERPCRCSQETISRYQSRISGPLLDRIDIMLEVPVPKANTLLSASKNTEESSVTIKARVDAAHALQLARQQCSNQALYGKTLEQHCALNVEGQKFISHTIEKLAWSARVLHRLLRVARTIADLEGKAQIHIHHLTEAVQYRRSLVREKI